MMIKARQWIRETFVPGSRPTLKDVKRWVDDGELDGRYYGGDLYISDSFATPKANRVKPAAPIDLLA